MSSARGRPLRRPSLLAASLACILAATLVDERHGPRFFVGDDWVTLASSRGSLPEGLAPPPLRGFEPLGAWLVGRLLESDGPDARVFDGVQAVLFGAMLVLVATTVSRVTGHAWLGGLGALGVLVNRYAWQAAFRASAIPFLVGEVLLLAALAVLACALEGGGDRRRDRVLLGASIAIFCLACLSRNSISACLVPAGVLALKAEGEETASENEEGRRRRRAGLLGGLVLTSLLGALLVNGLTRAAQTLREPAFEAPRAGISADPGVTTVTAKPISTLDVVAQGVGFGSAERELHRLRSGLALTLAMVVLACIPARRRSRSLGWALYFASLLVVELIATRLPTSRGVNESLALLPAAVALPMACVLSGHAIAHAVRIVPGGVVSRISESSRGIVAVLAVCVALVWAGASIRDPFAAERASAYRAWTQANALLVGHSSQPILVERGGWVPYMMSIFWGDLDIDFGRIEEVRRDRGDEVGVRIGKQLYWIDPGSGSISQGRRPKRERSRE